MEMELKDLLKMLLDSATKKNSLSQLEVFSYVRWFMKRPSLCSENSKVSFTYYPSVTCS